MATEILRHLLRDVDSLKDYRDGREPAGEEVRRRAFVRERSGHSAWPDQIFRGWQEHRLGAVSDNVSIQAMLRRLFETYAEHYLMVRDGKVHVQLDRFGPWQEELAALAPLPLVVFALERRHPAPDLADRGALADYIDTRCGQFRHTAIIAPFHPPVDDLIRRERLYETHLHLNGSTEVDVLWQAALRNPSQFQQDLDVSLSADEGTAITREMLRELYQQVEPGLTAVEMADRLEVGRRLRRAMVGALLASKEVGPRSSAVGTLTGWSPMQDEPAPPEDGAVAFDWKLALAEHPLRQLLSGNPTDLQMEAALLACVFRRLREHKDEWLARLLHCYLLILNATLLAFTVQSAAQKGFDQFQKFTFTFMRNLSEGRAYKDRFHQLCNGPPGDLALLEGRFAPKADLQPAQDQLLNILRSYADYLQEVRWRQRGGHGTPPSPSRLRIGDEVPPWLDREGAGPRLRLIAHFIKSDELATVKPGQAIACRFNGLRQRLARQWRVLRKLREDRALARRFITGIDGAANEMHAPPEVFAPVFRSARQSGMLYFTFHVGEDFPHLLTGMRAIMEALTFLDLRDGNRIGHGTAIGIEPTLWLERMPERFFMRRQDWLDDLVFLHEQLREIGERSALSLLPKIDQVIAKECHAIYGSDPGLYVLQKAWELRALDALMLEYVDKGPNDRIIEEEREELDKLLKVHREFPAAFDLWRRYHTADAVRAGRELVEVETGLVPADLLYQIQERVLREVIGRGVVIETLPTSNVRISHYKEHKEHHLFRWLGGPGERPLVSLGSDDPGIFACSMRGEVMHIVSAARKRTDMNEEQALALVRRLNDTGRIYAFM